MKALLVCLLVPACAAAQWPGYFYSFTLIDAAGKPVTASDQGYQMKPVKPTAKGSDVMLSILMCNDSTTIRFYVGGYHGLGDMHKLEITHLDTKEKMVLEFPSSFSGGKDKYYRNLFAGSLVFKKGSYLIRLPASDSAWDNLHELHFCPDYGGADSYWDISKLQKR
jgi:hypothetical protein